MTTATDRQTDGQAQNNRDNVLFTRLLIGLSVDFLRWWHVGVVCTRVCACVRESVRALVCVCVLLSRCCNENSQTYFCKHPTFINIHVTKRYITLHYSVIVSVFNTCILLPQPLSNDPRFIQCMYCYSHA